MKISINQWLSAALNPTVSSWVFHPGESEGEKQAGVSCAAQSFQSYCNTNPGQEANMFMTKHIFDGLNEKGTEHNVGEISQETQKSEDRNLLSSQLPKSTVPAQNCTASHTPLSPPTQALLGYPEEGMGVCIQVEITGEGTVPTDSTSTEGQKNDASRDTQDSKSKVQNGLTKSITEPAKFKILNLKYVVSDNHDNHPPQQEKENQQVNVPAQVLAKEFTEQSLLNFSNPSAWEPLPESIQINNQKQDPNQESGTNSQGSILNYEQQWIDTNEAGEKTRYVRNTISNVPNLKEGDTSKSPPQSTRQIGSEFYGAITQSAPVQFITDSSQTGMSDLPLASNGRPSSTEPDTAPLIKQARTDERSAGIVEPRNFNNGISDRFTVMSNAKPPKVELSEIDLLNILQNENNKNAQPSPTLPGDWGQGSRVEGQEASVLKPLTHDFRPTTLALSLLNQLQKQVHTTESEITVTEVIANEANNKTKSQQISVSLLNMNDVKSQNIPSHTVESRGESQESRVLTLLTHDSPVTTLALSLLNQLQKQVHTTESVITVKVAADQNIVASNDTVEVGEVIANEVKDKAKAPQTTIPPPNSPKNLTNPPITLADMDNIKPQNTPSQNIDKQIVMHQETLTEHTSAKEHVKNMQPENADVQPNVNKFNKEFNAPVYGDDSGGESQELRVINQDSRLGTQGSELKPHDLVKTVDLSLPKEKLTLDNMHRDLPANLITNDQYASTSISTLEEFDRQSLKDVPKTSNPNQTLESHYNSIIEQIAQKMRIHLREGKWDMNLRLDPPELGHIKLKFTIKGNRLEAQIEVEKLNVMYAIERDIPRLKESISSAGIDIGRLNVLCHEKSDDHHNPYFTYHTNPETQDSIEEDTNIESVEKADKRLVTTGINDALDIGRIDYIV